jgi:hypothetical protein
VCTADVSDEASECLAAILREMCEALEPDNPESVVIGPVDFGGGE